MSHTLSSKKGRSVPSLQALIGARGGQCDGEVSASQRNVHQAQDVPHTRSSRNGRSVPSCQALSGAHTRRNRRWVTPSGTYSPMNKAAKGVCCAVSCAHDAATVLPRSSLSQNRSISHPITPTHAKACVPKTLASDLPCFYKLLLTRCPGGYPLPCLCPPHPEHLTRASSYAALAAWPGAALARSPWYLQRAPTT